MNLQKTETDINDVLIIEPKSFPDERGFFRETYHREKYCSLGIEKVFVQDNHSFSKHGVIRGLHYQLQKPQAKLIYVISGEILDVAVDIRKSSPTFGKHVSVILSTDNCRQLYIPEGFAHGFSVLSESANVIYKCSDVYNPGDDLGILWSDREIGIDWKIENPIVSEKDRQNPLLKDMPKDKLPVFQK